MNYAVIPARSVTLKGTFMNSLFRPTDTPKTRVDSLSQLLLAEEILDELESLGNFTFHHHLLSCQAEAYILANPELLDKPWPRNGGAVYDMINRAKEQRLTRSEQLYQSTMSRM